MMHSLCKQKVITGRFWALPQCYCASIIHFGGTETLQIW